MFASFRSKIFSSIASGKKKNIAPHYKNYFLIPCDIFIDELHSFLIPALILLTNIHKISIAFMIEEWNAYSEKGSWKNKTKTINKTTEMKKITNRSKYRWIFIFPPSFCVPVFIMSLIDYTFFFFLCLYIKRSHFRHKILYFLNYQLWFNWFRIFF